MSGSGYTKLRELDVNRLSFRGPMKEKTDKVTAGAGGVTSYINYDGEPLTFSLPLMRTPWG